MKGFLKLCRTPIMSNLLITGTRCVHAPVLRKLPSEMTERSLAPSEIALRREEFLSYHKAFVEELVTTHGFAHDLPEVAGWWRRAFEYNLAGGKKNRGLIAYLTCVKLSEKDGQLTEERKRGAAAVGFGLEMLQASLLIDDDIMDYSETRRGQPCWHRLPDVGLMAINDAGALECLIYSLLKSHCGENSNFHRIVELFQDTRLKTIAGQCLDGLEGPSRYTMERYKRIVKFKTAFYSFRCPMISGMLLAEWDDDQLLEEVSEILMGIGEYFQIQDDFLDCYGDHMKTGKGATDIQEGKCTWLMVKALERAKPEQRRILQENYGSSDPERVDMVKQVYDTMDLQRIYEDFEDKTIKEIKDSIQNCRAGEPVATLLNTIVGLISKRQS